jgi:hypothetical protein
MVIMMIGSRGGEFKEEEKEEEEEEIYIMG